MGTRLIQQKRGKGGPRYRSPGHRFFSKVAYDFERKPIGGEVVAFVDDPARHALITVILTEDGSLIYNLASEGQYIGNRLELMNPEKIQVGTPLKLGDIPEGTPIFNIELAPLDGGKLARTPGSFCQRLAQDEDTGLVTILLGSKKTIQLKPECMATVGIVAGGGKNELPFMKAGNKFYAMKAKNRLWPKVRGRAMSAYDHPYGGKTGGKPTAVKRSTPPGRKAGHVDAKSTGRKKTKKA
ncbi:50S ribosomal protein L2 [Candidatus Micrarchaeota archaeon]|nr:50S ribosomal protein L2 [Candidatus Micrarchaeota archaeon]